ncbi:hypothetical protein [Zavarzinella formosa]|uniref:hypothetical protein n=1 Tax=Zavarzinella formosa TaxID=360055 RepID=UPI0012F75AC3|nr:hypothetical protein [Zavarzinella formosa]
MLTAVWCEGQPQGLMAVKTFPEPSKIGASGVLYVDYLETAPWNLGASARFAGIGTLLIAEAVFISLGRGLGGRVGLHSLPQAEPFYTNRCRMTSLGPDPGYYDLAYFEYTEQQAADFLSRIGMAP